MRSLLVAASLGAVNAGTLDLSKDPMVAFQEFKERYHLTFEGEEDAKRFRIFKDNMKNAHALGQKEPTAQYGASKFAHLTSDEFSKMLGFKPKAGRKRFPKKHFPKVANGSIDWRDLGGVSPVKDQGQCGSCWAFSATEAVETGYWKSSGDMQILSPQQIVSCDRGDGACNGGDTVSAYDYVQQAGGLEPESAYPYVSGTSERRGTCRADQSEFAVQVDSVNTVSQDPYGEDDMYSAIMQSGMSICVDASSWQMYMGGVVTSETCGEELDHCVFLAGIKSGEYWIVKNSWNTDWGEEGYIRVKTGQNACGIAMEATTIEASAEDPWAAKHLKKKSSPEQAVIDVISGFSEGFGVKMEAQCVSDSESLMGEISKAVALMQKGTPEAMMEAMEVLSAAMEKEWPAAVKSCGGTAAELVKIFEALHILQHPKAFAYHVGKDLIVNGVDIYDKMNASIGAFKQQEYHDFGFDIGAALKELLIGLTSSSPNTPNRVVSHQRTPVTPQDVVDVVNGISEGFGVKMEEQCVGDGEGLLEKVEKAMQLAQKKNPVDMLEAMHILAEALETDWPAAVKACEGTADELVKIFSALQILKHPKAFAYHVGQDLLVNGVDIFDKVNTAIGQFKAHKLYDFGFSIGGALNELIVGKPEEEIKEEIFV